MKDMTREQIIAKGRSYDKIQNEGGEGYNPYWSELERREMEENQRRAAQPKTKKEQIEALHDKIRIECGSVAREWGGEEADKKQATYYAEIKKLEAEIDAEFAEEWTLELTQERRASWNGFVRSLMNSKGQIDTKNQGKMYQKASEQGWGLEQLKKAVKLHNLGPAK